MMNANEKKISDSFLEDLAASLGENLPLKAVYSTGRSVLEQYEQFLKCVRLRQEIEAPVPPATAALGSGAGIGFPSVPAATLASPAVVAGSFEWACAVASSLPEGQRVFREASSGLNRNIITGGVYTMEDVKATDWQIGEIPAH